MAETERIVIAEKIYIGYSDRTPTKRVDGKNVRDETQDVCKLGFATYYENNAACRKRQGTIDSWAGSSKDIWAPETLENAPLPGYRISKKVTHGGGWNDITVHWRIVDPRGFELEISSGNLAKLFQYCTIDRGVISGECVYGFDKGNSSKVVLLPVNSEIYLESVQSTAVHTAKAISVKDIKLGDTITLKNGTTGTYLGKPTAVYSEFERTWTEEKGDPAMTLHVGSFHVLLRGDGGKQPTIYMFATPNIIKVESGLKVFTESDAGSELNNLLQSGASVTQAGGQASLNNTAFFTFDKISLADVNYGARELSVETYMEGVAKQVTTYSSYGYYAGHGTVGVVLGELSTDGKTYALWHSHYRPYYEHHKTPNSNAQYGGIISRADDKITFKKGGDRSQPRSYYSYYHEAQLEQKSTAFSDFTKLWQITVEYRGTAYTAPAKGYFSNPFFVMEIAFMLQ